MTFFTKRVAASTVFKVLSSDRSRCGEEGQHVETPQHTYFLDFQGGDIMNESEVHCRTTLSWLAVYDNDRLDTFHDKVPEIRPLYAEMNRGNSEGTDLSRSIIRC